MYARCARASVEEVREIPSTSGGSHRRYEGARHRARRTGCGALVSLGHGSLQSKMPTAQGVDLNPRQSLREFIDARFE